MLKSDRDELRRIIRQRFRVLRADVDARKAELVSELDSRLDAKYEQDLKLFNDTEYLVDEAVREANRKVNDLYRAHYGADRWGTDRDKALVSSQRPASPERAQGAERSKEVRSIEAMVASAYTELERREVQLLEDLAVGALESAEAKEFLAKIPTVGELVPAARLNEIGGP